MALNDYTLIGGWRTGAETASAVAQKDGKEFMIKRYLGFFKPLRNGMFDDKTVGILEEEFERFADCRTRVNSTLRSRRGAENLIVPCEEFVEEGYYYEVSAAVNGVVPAEELEPFIKSLPLSSKLLIMRTAAGALSTVHSAGIVHGDLNPNNVLIAKNGAGDDVAKLTGFDVSCFLDDIRLFGKDNEYCSPELGLYSNVEEDEEKEEFKKFLSEKSDIFSLGVIFHFYLTGALPQPDVLSESLRKEKERREAAGKRVFFYPWNVLVRGGTLKIDDGIKPAGLRTLLSSMMSLMPEDRPTASQVLKKLITLKEESFEEPWPDHRIEWNEEQLRKSGYVSGERALKSGIESYVLVRADGSREVFFQKDTLTGMNLAFDLPDAPPDTLPDAPPDILPDVSPDAPPSAPEEDLWPEDHFTFHKEKLRSRGYTSIERQVLNGVKGYSLIKENGDKRFVRSDAMVPLGYAIPD